MRILQTIVSLLITLKSFDGYCQTNVTTVYTTLIDSNRVSYHFISRVTTETSKMTSTHFFDQNGDTTSFSYLIQDINGEDSILISSYSGVHHYFYNHRRKLYKEKNLNDSSCDSSLYYYNSSEQIICKYHTYKGWIHIDSTFYKDSLINKRHKYVNNEFWFIETYYHNEKGQLIKKEVHDTRGKLRRQIIYDYDKSSRMTYYKNSDYDYDTRYFEKLPPLKNVDESKNNL
jgi:hypothetical protein